ncbi:hypothetical protein KM043_003794 [Ampulex compressa]|nr:hypothetical protein KM043_003794 [Ampulex compressa]
MSPFFERRGETLAHPRDERTSLPIILAFLSLGRAFGGTSRGPRSLIERSGGERRSSAGRIVAIGGEREIGERVEKAATGKQRGRSARGWRRKAEPGGAGWSEGPGGSGGPGGGGLAAARYEAVAR